MKYKAIKKLYYSISEVSEMLDIKQSVIRYWESEFKELKPQKNRAGNRIYKKDDIAILRMINHYVHGKHLSIHEANEVIMDLKAEGLYKRKLQELNEIEVISPPAEEKVELVVENKHEAEEMIEEVEEEPETIPEQSSEKEPEIEEKFEIVNPTEGTFIYPLDEPSEDEISSEDEIIEPEPEIPQVLEESSTKEEIIEIEPVPEPEIIKKPEIVPEIKEETKSDPELKELLKKISSNIRDIIDILNE